MYQYGMMCAVFVPILKSFGEFWKYQYTYARDMNLALAYQRYSEQEWFNIFNIGFGVMIGEWWCLMWQSFYLTFNWLYVLLVWDPEWTDLWGWLRDFLYGTGEVAQ